MIPRYQLVGCRPILLCKKSLNSVLGISQALRCTPHEVIELCFVKDHIGREIVNEPAVWPAWNYLLGNELSGCYYVEHCALKPVCGWSKLVQLFYARDDLDRDIKRFHRFGTGDAGVVAQIMDMMIRVLMGPNLVVLRREAIDVGEEKQPEATSSIRYFTLLCFLTHQVLSGRYRHCDKDCKYAANSLEPCRCICSKGRRRNEVKQTESSEEREGSQCGAVNYAAPANFFHEIRPYPRIHWVKA